MSSDVAFTNVTSQPAGQEPKRINGHRCQAAIEIVSASDGAPVAFEVWRAVDSERFPMRVSTATKFAQITLQCFKLQLAPQPDDVFQPPEGFTAYESVEGMMGELAMRRANLKRNEPTITPPETTLKGTPGQGQGGPGGH